MFARESIFPFLCLATLVFCAEFIAVDMLFQPQGALIALGIHASVILALSLLGYVQRKKNPRLQLFLIPLVATTGPVGVGIGVFAMIIYVFSAKEDFIAEEWIDEFFSHNEEDESDRLHERIVFGLDNQAISNNVEPFQDILIGGSIAQKQAVIAKITRYFSSKFAPLLLLAAQDSNAAVRVQAATALAKIERDFMAHNMRLENELNDIPDDNPEKLKLAKLYDEYAHAGLLDEESRYDMRAKAIRIYEAHYAAGKNPEVEHHLARLYLRQNHPARAREILEASLQRGDIKPTAIFWYMEALYKLKDYRRLKYFARGDYSIEGSENVTRGLLEESRDKYGVWGGKNRNLTFAGELYYAS